MKNAILIGFAVAATAGFVYLNDYQNEMMNQRMDGPPPTAPKEPEVDLPALAKHLRAVVTVIVPVTRESQAAVSRAVQEKPDARVCELGVSLEDLPYEIDVPDGFDRFRTVRALIVLTQWEYLTSDHSFRTDTPLGALKYVRDHPKLDYLVLNPRHESAQHDEEIVFGPEQIEKLIELLR